MPPRSRQLDSGLGFDLGDTLCEYAGVPLNWEHGYPSALAAVARLCGLEPTPGRLQSGTRVLLRFNTRVTPRRDEREYTAEHIFRELLAEWGSPGDVLAGSIAAFFGHFRQTLRAFPESAMVLAKLRQLGVPTGVLTDVPYGMPRDLVDSTARGGGILTTNPDYSKGSRPPAMELRRQSRLRSYATLTRPAGR